ncbi:MAG TPA: hypothetical protein VL241_07125, partial [Gemmatimonadales bacterium]|nr:hypothetical protein [Gemmatimonadales bacterium]
SEFLLSPRARNFVFGADQWDYSARLDAWRYQYWNLAGGTAAFLRGIAIAILFATATSRLGLWVGGGMARVQR